MEERKAHTRARLLEEAAKLFYARGFAATSLEQIAEGAEVTKGAIYRHFASKEDLFLELVREGGQVLDTTVLSNASLSVEERLAALGGHAAEMIAKSDSLGEALNLEYLAACLRRPDSLAQHADYVRSALEQHRFISVDGGVRLKRGAKLTEFQLEIVAQALVDGLMIYRFIFPDDVDASTFAAAMELLAAVLEPSSDEQSDADVKGRTDPPFATDSTPREAH